LHRHSIIKLGRVHHWAESKNVWPIYLLS